MNDRIKLATASLSDLSVVDEMEKALFRPSDRFSVRRIKYLISSNNALVLLSKEKNLNIGYGIALKTLLRDGRVKGRIYSLGVVEDKRRRGVGAQILKALEDWLEKQGAHFITLETRLGKNVSFYKKRGYQPTAKLPEYYGEATGLRLRKVLKEPKKRDL
jgi:ribosomal protein S18 acetylase RimI-like enzyme